MQYLFSEKEKQEHDGQEAIVYHFFETLEELNALKEMMRNKGVMAKVRIPIKFMPNQGSVYVDKIEFEKKFPLIKVITQAEAAKSLQAKIMRTLKTRSLL